MWRQQELTGRRKDQSTHACIRTYLRDRARARAAEHGIRTHGAAAARASDAVAPAAACEKRTRNRCAALSFFEHFFALPLVVYDKSDFKECRRERRERAYMEVGARETDDGTHSSGVKSCPRFVHVHAHSRLYAARTWKKGMLFYILVHK